MAKQRWIVKLLGDAAFLSKAKLSTLLKGNSINIIDMGLFPKLVLVEGSEEKINELKSQIDLTFSPDETYKVPDARKKVQHH